MKRLAVLLFLVVACGTPSDPSEPTNPTHPLGWGKTVEEVTLTDGTHCATIRSSEGGVGISCDWRER